jgi:hypothetical protein
MNMPLVEALTKECLKKIHSLGLPNALSVRKPQECGLAYYRALMVEACSAMMLMSGRLPEGSVVNDMIQAAFTSMKVRLQREGSETQSIVDSSGTNAPIPPESQSELEQGKQDRDSLGHSGP